MESYFFIQTLSWGGYIFVHDYNNKEFRGLRNALLEAENILGEKIAHFALPDQGGTLVITKT